MELLFVCILFGYCYYMYKTKDKSVITNIMIMIFGLFISLFTNHSEYMFGSLFVIMFVEALNLVKELCLKNIHFQKFLPRVSAFIASSLICLFLV